MKNLFETTETSQFFTAFLFVLAFVLLVVIYRIWSLDNLHLTWKMICMGIYVTGLLRFFTPKQLVRFMGYCMMLLGLKYVWYKPELSIVWKVAAVIAVLFQFYPFSKMNINILNKKNDA